MVVYDLIIIGGGPAGITAGIYAARQKLNTLLITKEFGGQIARKAVGIENYPGFEEISGLDLIKKFEKHLRRASARSDGHKIDIERDGVRKVKKIGEKFLVQTTGKNTFEAKAVIIASGADPRPLEVPGEKEFLSRGVSYCIVCDSPLFEGKTVAVIGGGNAGFEAAIFLARFAKKIYILEYSEKISADVENQERVKKTGKIEIIINAQVKKIKGRHPPTTLPAKGGAHKFVNSLVYLDRKTGKEVNLAVEGIFIEIGTQPATSFVKDLVEFNEKDEIKVNPFTGQTSCPGLFAAGDCDNVSYKQIVIAAGEGAKAALSAYEYLQKGK